MSNSNLLWNWKGPKNTSYFVKAIASLFEEGSATFTVLKSGFQVVIGDGGRANFWEMPGRDLVSLKLTCPRIFALAIKKQGAVKDFGRWVNDSGVGDSPAQALF